MRRIAQTITGAVDAPLVSMVESALPP